MILFGVFLLHALQQSEAYEPVVQGASEEGRRAMESFELAEGLEAALFAAEPMLANPVCLYVDASGDCYVGETFRHTAGVTDLRDHMDWLDDEMATRSVEDRVALLRKHEGDGFDAYGIEHDRVRLLEDPDGDGQADRSTVFADGFNHPAAGIGAGLLSYRGEVFYTCIPDLWRLRDRDGDGVSDDRSALSSGYGVNIAMLGHDLHGLRIGFDGRLYFSSGDRGFRVETESGVLDHHHTGAVLRCELDGSRLEVVHTGLRNPQELAFDALGNLFTGDNNSDGGDRARWVSVVEGGDSGWRYSYQWITSPVSRGPWNDEKLWHPPFDGQAAYLVPPIANLASGPSGLCYYPGTGLLERYADHFFLCDFRGDPSFSGIHAFRSPARGAFFELGEVEPLAWGVLATDADFGPDGALYVSDWVTGWQKTGKGRVYRLFDAAGDRSGDARGTRELLAGGLGQQGLSDLGALLGHADQRVRQEAQFELVRRGREGWEELERRSAQGELLARLHGIWGLGMAARLHGASAAALIPRLEDAQPEVRAQAARTLGDLGYAAAGDRIVRLLGDESARVAFFAAIAAGRLALADAVPGLARLLERAAQEDPNLRHAAVMGLTGCASENALVELARSASEDVRVGAVVALRRRGSASIVAGWEDGADGRAPSERLVLEVARAIHDVPIPGALEALAVRLDGSPVGEAALVRRMLNANFRLGTARHGRRLVDFAARSEAAPSLRAEALELLAAWDRAELRDRVTNVHDPLPPREMPSEIALWIRELLPAMDRAPDEVLLAWLGLVGRAQARGFVPELEAWVLEDEQSGPVRIAALEVLESFAHEGLADVLDRALAANDSGLRAAAFAALERAAPKLFLARLASVVEEGTYRERRMAYQALGRLEHPRVGRLLLHELERMAAGLVPAELRLDLVQACRSKNSPELRSLLGEMERVRSIDPRVAPYLDGLFGGDAELGRGVFERVDLSCTRCHAVVGHQPERVGPDLEGLSERSTRLEMLEAIVDPNRRTSPGYDASALFLFDGSVVAGRVIGEDETTVRVQGADGTVVSVDKQEVEERRRDLSAMPDNVAERISPLEMRDLLEYLGSL